MLAVATREICTMQINILLLLYCYAVHYLTVQYYRLLSTRGGTGSGLPVLTPAGFCVFPSDPVPESKICEKTDPDGVIFPIRQ